MSLAIALLAVLVAVSSIWLAALQVQDAGDVTIDGGNAFTDFNAVGRSRRRRLLPILFINGT